MGGSSSENERESTMKRASSQEEKGSTMDEYYSFNEMKLNDQPNILMRNILRISKATCKITTVDGSGSGFLVCLPIPSSNNPLYGLLTNNHVLPRELISDGEKIHIYFEFEARSIEVKFTSQRSRFSDPLLDFTFVQMNLDEFDFIKEGKFLFIQENLEIKKKVVIGQHMKGQDLVIEEGIIRCVWGFDYLHEVNTEYGSSGSAICNTSGEVVGLHKARRPDQKCNVGTRIQYIHQGIRNLFLYPNLPRIANFSLARTPLTMMKLEH